MKRKLIVLGSTGSIGTQTLDVVAQHPEHFEVTGLVGGNNIDRLEKQIRDFQPAMVAVATEAGADLLSAAISDLPTTVLWGTQGILNLVEDADYHLMVMALVGTLGLRPVMTGISRGKDVALATKEVLVAAGELVMEESRKQHVRILPVDSEHSAIFQCLQGEDPDTVQRIILTASGGPFRDTAIEQMGSITPSQALQHPNWKMGQKISIDSATMVNKGLEVLEAKWLFDCPLDLIQVLIHRQSIVHSMVEFCDGSVKAQLGLPDMRVPIQYALGYPRRLMNSYPLLDLTRISALTFEHPDLLRFPGLSLAYEAGRIGGTMPAVFNAANEKAVERFLSGDIGFMGIAALIMTVMEQHRVHKRPSMEEILESDNWARRQASQWRDAPDKKGRC
jgi:1-deoxy-D-xylulose-5-phosphate reductoisomerase